eukprot:6458582-Amphidinium_carterae.2
MSHDPIGNLLEPCACQAVRVVHRVEDTTLRRASGLSRRWSVGAERWAGPLRLPTILMRTKQLRV